MRTTMAMIMEKSSGRQRALEAEHLVGRGPASGLVIAERYVSARHAILRFAGDRWELRDLGSRNGTFLDGVRLQPGEEYPLARGARIAFGKVDQEWTLLDDAPPWAMAVPLDGGEPVELQGDLLALPSSDEPRATIYRNPDGAWVLEQTDSIAPVTNLQTFEVAGRAFRFSCPDNIAKTTLAESSSALEIRHLTLLFSVSRDEEHVELRASCGARSFDLGTRLHNYLLLILARRRLADAAEGLPETSCGWLYQEDFPNEPSLEPQRLNLDVLRIRQQFAALGISDAANIIERRPRTRQLRIGVNRLSVVVL